MIRFCIVPMVIRLGISNDDCSNQGIGQILVQMGTHDAKGSLGGDFLQWIWFWFVLDEVLDVKRIHCANCKDVHS